MVSFSVSPLEELVVEASEKPITRPPNRFTSEEGESYDSYVPPTAVSRSTSKSLDFFFTACYVRTENDDDYIFTEDMYADYKEYALDESYAYCFPNYDAFAKAVRAELQLKSGRKRKSSDANPKRCYLGIKRKALVTEEQAED